MALFPAGAGDPFSLKSLPKDSGVSYFVNTSKVTHPDAGPSRPCMIGNSNWTARQTSTQFVIKI